MLWGKSKPTVEVSCNSAKINDRALLDFRGHRYLTLVEDVHAGEVHISAPLEKGQVIRAAEGEQVMLSIFIDDGLRRYSAKVVRMDLQSIPLVVLGEFRDLGVVQRRRYDRVEERLKIRYRPEPVNKLFEGLWSDAFTSDISAGGLQMVIRANTGFKLGEKLDVEFLIPGSKAVHALCKVMRVNPAPNTTNVGLAFIKITGADRDQIHRYVRNRQKQMEAERRRMTRVRLTHQIPMDYTVYDIKRQTGNGQILEISLGGLRFTTADSYGMRSGRLLDMGFPLNERQNLTIRGEISQVLEAHGEDGPLNTVAVRFEELDNNSMESIAAFIGHVMDYGQSTCTKSA